MRFLSLCSGIEAASAAWLPLGWQPAAYAEIDPFCCALLEARHPGVPNLGDLTAITDGVIAGLGPIDLVIGGTPCQDLSVAGQRAGLAGIRSGLFFDYLRIVNAARAFCGARWAVWENVPGAFSSHQGRDFARVVGELAGCALTPPDGGWGSEGVALGEHGLAEWAVLDAQWFGVAQRRKRVFVVVDFGDWRSRRPVLLEPESVRGDRPTRSTAGARVAGTLTPSALDGSSPRGGDGKDSFLVAGPLLSSSNGAGWRSGAEEAAMNHLIPDVADPITASEGDTYTHEGANNFRLHNVVAPLVAVPLTHGGHPGSNAQGRRKEDDENLVIACFDETQITHRENRSTAAPDTAALAASARPPAIAFSLRGREEGNVPEVDPDGIVPALRTGGGGSGNPMVLDPQAFEIANVLTARMAKGINTSVDEGQTPVLEAGAVRRLTPRECERLQGFPDDFTLIEFRGKPAADSQRYAALGNSMAVPVVAWIGQRLDAVSARP